MRLGVIAFVVASTASGWAQAQPTMPSTYLAPSGPASRVIIELTRPATRRVPRLFVRSAERGLARPWREVCELPCVRTIVPGSYALAIGLDDGAPVPVDEGLVRLEASGTLEVEYDDGHGRRRAGGVLVLLGLAIGIGLGTGMAWFAGNLDGSGVIAFGVGAAVVIGVGVVLVAVGAGLLASRDSARARLTVAALGEGVRW